MTHKIQTKEMAHNLLFHLHNNLEEQKMFANPREGKFLLIAQSMLLQMRHSIDNENSDLFKLYFKDKEPSEIIQWIESESTKW